MVFWSLTLYDLHVPKERYDEEINKAKDVITALENNQEMVRHVSVHVHACAPSMLSFFKIHVHVVLSTCPFPGQ